MPENRTPDKNESAFDRASRKRAERLSRTKRRNRAPFVPDTSVPSPCVSVCMIDIDQETRLCKGCLRSIDEIRDWMIMSADDKRSVLAKIETRK